MANAFFIVKRTATLQQWAVKVVRETKAEAEAASRELSKRVCEAVKVGPKAFDEIQNEGTWFPMNYGDEWFAALELMIAAEWK